MDKMIVAKNLADKLKASELSLDEAMANASELLGGVLAARAELNVAPGVTDPAVAKIVEAVSALSSARSALITAHGELNEAKLRIGIRHRMDIYPKNLPTKGEDAAAVTLRQVG